MKTSGRKERDVKFIIYQSLYIFVIATLGFHGLNLYDITKIPPKNLGDTTISKVLLDSLVNRLPKDDETIVPIDSMFVMKNEIEELRRKLKECEAKIGDSGRLKGEIEVLKSQLNQKSEQLEKCRKQLEEVL